jgi:starch phosphorylase
MSRIAPVAAKQRFLERLAQYVSRNREKLVAYFCMEYGLRRDVPIYSGGLGVLAGDTLKSAAQMGDPMIALGLLYRDGYFRQEIVDGKQEHKWERLNPSRHPQLVDLGEEGVEVEIAGQKVAFRLWGHEVEGGGDNFVPLLLLDSLGFPNPPGMERITRYLYPDLQKKLYQEIALGIGGMRTLAKWEIHPPNYHLNEGHAAFAPVEFLRSLGIAYENLSAQHRQLARERFSFTTHTPVPAGFDSWHHGLVASAFSDPFLRAAVLGLGRDPRNADYINMAYLAMRLSGVVNAVSELHAKVSDLKFPDSRPILPITNGIHHLTWASESMAKLYDEFCPAWREDPSRLKELGSLASREDFREKLWHAHQEAKAELFKHIRKKTGQEFDENVFTVGFARRFADYKRGDLIFKNPDELLRLAEEKGGLQIVVAGKAHPRDSIGQGMLANVIKQGQELTARSGGKIKVVFLPDYNLDIGKLMVAGSDVWLNNPLPPNEASGTSGMKAAMNGVPQASTWDGWWVEGSRDDTTGWTIGGKGDREGGEQDPDRDLYLAHSVSLYKVLRDMMEKYYQRQTDPTFINKMIAAIAENGSFFNTHRMVSDYRRIVWPPERIITAAPEIEAEPVVAREAKLVNLAEVVYQITLAGESGGDIEDLAARGMIRNLRRSFRVTRYDVFKERVRIGRRWLGGGFGETIFEERRADFGKTFFGEWRKLGDFEKEVMADVVRRRETQVVPNPAEDGRCQRDGHLISENPFIMVPEIVNGDIVGVIKVDFRPGVKLGESLEKEFVDTLLKFVGPAKVQGLKRELSEDLAKFDSAEKLVSWMLTLMTAGGFADMPECSTETNRVIFFEDTPDGLVGRLAVGDVNENEHRRNLNEVRRNFYTDGFEKVLRGIDHSRSGLSQIVAGQNIGENVVLGPILYRNNDLPDYDRKDFSGGGFDGSKLEALRQRVVELLRTDGVPVKEYLFYPVKSPSGVPLGLIYADNAFSKTPISAGKYRNLVAAFGEALARMKRS